MRLRTFIIACFLLAVSIGSIHTLWKLSDANSTLHQQLNQRTTQVDIENVALRHRLVELERYAHERGVDLSAYAGAAAGGGVAPPGEPDLPD